MARTTISIVDFCHNMTIMQALRILVHVRWHPHNREYYVHMVLKYYNLMPNSNAVTTPQSERVYRTAKRIYREAKTKIN